MKEIIFRLTIETELNNKTVELEFDTFAENRKNAETMAIKKLIKRGYNIEKFRVLKVENPDFINL